MASAIGNRSQGNFAQPTAHSIPPQKPFNYLPFIVAGFIGLVLIVILVVVLLSYPGTAGTFSGFELKPRGVAIIPLKGEITNSGSDGFSGSSPSANDVVDMINDAEKNNDVGAILLDIDSPGGEVVASKQIVYTIRESRKPVYAYINSTGASGAYYVAASTSYIMADRDSITGSIGVISEIPNIAGLLDKLGVQVNVLKQGQHKDIGSPFRSMNADDNAIFNAVLAQVYQGFKQDILAFRKGNISGAQLDSIADGRILTGKQALDAGLVDELVTTRREAIDRAAELSGIKNPHDIPYEKPKFTLSNLFFNAGASFGSGLVQSLQASSEASAPELR